MSFKNKGDIKTFRQTKTKKISYRQRGTYSQAEGTLFQMNGEWLELQEGIKSVNNGKSKGPQI